MHSSDDLERLGDAIAELSALIQTATYELLVLIREFDERNGWNQGFLSCAHWLQWRTGLALGVAREKVRVARALGTLPRISAAMARGEISYSKVRALTRVATPETDGMVVVRGRLTPEVGAVVQRALDAASDRLFKGSAQAAATGEVTSEQRRADAIGLIAESALAGTLDRGTTGDRSQVVIHVDEATLHHRGESGQAAVDDPRGLRVSAGTSQRVACDASTVVMRHRPDGSVLDVGRKTRIIPPALRRALAARDWRCRFPGCEARRCDAHHIEAWADGGGTSLKNLVLLCRHHHRAVHEEGFTLRRGLDGEVEVRRPDGRLLVAAPRAPSWMETGSPLTPTLARLAANDIMIDANTATPEWLGERLDVGWAIDVLHPAATGSGGDVPAGTSGACRRH